MPLAAEAVDIAYTCSTGPLLPVSGLGSCHPRLSCDRLLLRAEALPFCWIILDNSPPGGGGTAQGGRRIW